MPLGAKITVPGLFARDTCSRIIPPVTAGLRLWNYPLVSADRASANLYAGSTDTIQAIGAIDFTGLFPTSLTPYATLTDGSAYQQSSIQGLPVMTIHQLVKTDGAYTNPSDLPTFAATYFGPSAANPARTITGFRFYVSATDGTVVLVQYRWDGSQLRAGLAGLSGANIPNLTNWTYLIGKQDATRTAVKDMTNNHSQTTTQGFGPVDPPLNTIRIGGDYSAGTGGVCSIAFTAIFDQYLSDADDTTVYSLIKSMMAAREGISI